MAVAASVAPEPSSISHPWGMPACCLRKRTTERNVHQHQVPVAYECTRLQLALAFGAAAPYSQQPRYDQRWPNDCQTCLHAAYTFLFARIPTCKTAVFKHRTPQEADRAACRVNALRAHSATERA